DVVAPRLVFSVRKRAAELGGNAQHAEIVGGNRGRAKRLRLSLRRQTNSPIFIRSGHVREHVICRSPGDDVGRGDRSRVGEESLRRIERSNDGHAVGVETRRTAQQEGAHETKHGGVHGDAQRQCQDGDGGEARILAQCAKAIAKVCEEALDRGPAPNFPAIFFNQSYISKFAAGGGGGFFSGHAGGDESLDFLLKVFANLFGEFAL